MSRIFGNATKYISPSIDCSMGSTPVGVQCPLTSSLGEFPGYYEPIRFWYPGLSPVLVSITFSLHLPYLSVLHDTLHLPLNFTHVSSLRLMYLHPSVDPSLTYFLCEFPGSGTQCCSPRGGAWVCIKQKSCFKFMSMPGFEPRTLQSDDHERYPLDYSAHPKYISKLVKTIWVCCHSLKYGNIHLTASYFLLLRYFITTKLTLILTPNDSHGLTVL